MGEIADDIIDGGSCALCGQPFIAAHGYPVACNHCWEEGCGYQKATEPLGSEWEDDEPPPFDQYLFGGCPID